MAFDKAAVKAAFTALAQSVAVVVQRGTVANAVKFDNKTVEQITDLAAQKANERTGQHPVQNLVNFSAAGAPENVYVSGTPNAIASYMTTNKVTRAIGRATSLVGSIAPDNVRITPPLPNQMADAGLGDSGIFIVESLGPDVVRRTYIRNFIIKLYGPKHNITFEQYGVNNDWSPWNVIDEGVIFSSDEIDGFGVMGGPWPAATVHNRINSDKTVIFKEEASLRDTGSREYMPNALYIFTVPHWYDYQVIITGEPGVTITCAGEYLPQASGRGAIVFARRIAENQWYVYGDLKRNPNRPAIQLYSYNNAGLGEPANFDIVHWNQGPDYRAIVNCKDQTVGSLRLPVKSTEPDQLDLGFPIGGQIDFLMTANAACVLTITCDEPTYELVVQSGKVATVSKKNAKFSLLRASATKWILSGDGLDNV